MRTLLPLILLASLAAACSSTASPPPLAGDGSPTEDTGDASFRPDGTASCTGGGVWKATSRHIEMRSFGFFAGGSGYARDRSTLTDAQRAALDKLCVIPTPTQRASDITEYAVTVTDEDGSKAEYLAVQNNLASPSGRMRSTIDIHSLQPFLLTFTCLEAGRTRETPPTMPPWSEAPSVNTDSGCFNGIFMPYGCHQVWLKLDVQTPATHRLELTRCFDVPTLKLYRADGATELAASAPGSATACPALTHTFEQAGSYLVAVEKANETACDAGSGTAGDFFLRVEQP